MATVEKIAPEELQAVIEVKRILPSTVSFSLSPVFKQNRDALTESIRSIVAQLQVGGYSEPVVQKSELSEYHCTYLCIARTK